MRFSKSTIAGAPHAPDGRKTVTNGKAQLLEAGARTEMKSDRYEETNGRKVEQFKWGTAINIKETIQVTNGTLQIWANSIAEYKMKPFMPSLTVCGTFV